jgi:hypothetical protein
MACYEMVKHHDGAQISNIEDCPSRLPQRISISNNIERNKQN